MFHIYPLAKITEGRGRRVAVKEAEPLKPSAWAEAVLGFVADAMQTEVLDTEARRVLLCCTRQWGKSTVTAVRALYQAWHRGGSTIVCVCPTQRQSELFLAKVREFLPRLGCSWSRDRREAHSVRLPNGSAIIGLPAIASNIKGFTSVSLLILDEAAEIPDAVYAAVRPFLAVSQGDLWMLSTPNGESGFFYNEWHSDGDRWARFTVTATDCARIGAEFLAGERASLGERDFAEQYLCRFLPPAGQLIPVRLIEACLGEEEAYDLDGWLKEPVAFDCWGRVVR